MLVGRVLRKKLFNSQSTISLFIWEARLSKGSFRTKALTFVMNVMENRLRHTRGPVHLHCVCYMCDVGYFTSNVNQPRPIYWLFFSPTFQSWECHNLAQNHLPKNISFGFSFQVFYLILNLLICFSKKKYFFLMSFNNKLLKTSNPKIQMKKLLKNMKNQLSRFHKF